MANIMRWRYGETNPVTLPSSSEDLIEIGDLIYLEKSVGRPANTLDGSPVMFHNGFVGVAMQRSPIGDTEPIRIATSGVFEFDTDSETFNLGDRIGVARADSRLLENQKVIAVLPNRPELSIGRVCRAVPVADTKVFVQINSTILGDGPQAVA